MIPPHKLAFVVGVQGLLSSENKAEGRSGFAPPLTYTRGREEIVTGLSLKW